MRERDTTNLDDIRRSLRLGMGPCQGGFCIYRATGILHGVEQLDALQANDSLRYFLAGALEGRLADPLRRPAAPGAPGRLDLPGPARRGAPAGVTSTGWAAPSYDVLVIGAGLAGLSAAARLAEGGAKVMLIAKGVGATHLGPGTIDVLGYAGAEDARRAPGRGARRPRRRPPVRAARRRRRRRAERRLVQAPVRRRPARRLPLPRLARGERRAADDGRRARSRRRSSPRRWPRATCARTRLDADRRLLRAARLPRRLPRRQRRRAAACRRARWCIDRRVDGRPRPTAWGSRGRSTTPSGARLRSSTRSRPSAGSTARRGSASPPALGAEDPHKRLAATCRSASGGRSSRSRRCRRRCPGCASSGRCATGCGRTAGGSS